MNAIFLIFCTLSLAIIAVFYPTEALPAMLGGINKAINLSLELLAVYALWAGVFKIAEHAGLTQKLAAKLTPAIKRLFGKTSDKTAELISLNLTANMLGMSGLATPYGIKACAALEQENNCFGARLLLILSAASVQLLPTSVMALMAEKGSENPASIILPAFLSTAVSTILGAILAFVFKPSGKKRLARRRKKSVNNKTAQKNADYKDLRV